MVAALIVILTLTVAVGFLAVVLLWRHAERDRRHAADELQFADLLLSEICSSGRMDSPRFLVGAGDDAIAALQRTIGGILQLRTKRTDDPATCRQLVQLPAGRQQPDLTAQATGKAGGCPSGPPSPSPLVDPDPSAIARPVASRPPPVT